jgi:SAM-dependent methyltransferase
MHENTSNFLYSRPEYLEIMYSEPGRAKAFMCRRMFERYLPEPPASLLDVGCGTGLHLEILSRWVPECWGLDCSPEMIDYARRARPQFTWRVADMRGMRLGRRFDAVLCLGSTLIHLLTDRDLERTLESMARHIRAGGLLVLDVLNAARLLGAPDGNGRTEFAVDHPGVQARSDSRMAVDRRRQVLEVARTWSVPGRGPVHDRCRYRLLFPLELEGLLRRAGFTVLGMFDNTDLDETDLWGHRLYVAAVR